MCLTFLGHLWRPKTQQKPSRVFRSPHPVAQDLDESQIHCARYDQLEASDETRSLITLPPFITPTVSVGFLKVVISELNLNFNSTLE
jgi:hypothetical protein